MVFSKWKKAKQQALGCLQIPRTLDDDKNPSTSGGPDVCVAHRPPEAQKQPRQQPSPQTSSSFSQKLCTICQHTMKPTDGQAIVIAECTHSFHLSCITSNVKHGNRRCPICRREWKHIPFQTPASEPPGNLRGNPIAFSGDLALLRQTSPRQSGSYSHAPEPYTFHDDERIEDQPMLSALSVGSTRRVEMKTFLEVSAILKPATYDDFTVLIHLKAPVADKIKDGSAMPTGSQSSHAPIDLVAVLDVSGSMAGTKLALLKRAMGFVIQHLGPYDRLSVVAFSSAASRLFPLRRMTDSGRHQALQAVNSLLSDGGTNIAEGLRKGAKVLFDRTYRNPVCGIMLLSDGKDSYIASGPSGSRIDYKLLLPNSMQENSGTGLRIPFHTFGFGTDHDAVAMHSISEGSGGTFSFIETESVIQDAFAQCIGGLLSVVTQELMVKIECVHPELQLSSIKAGNYSHQLMADARTGQIDVRDLYAEEERDFLVTMNVPAATVDEMTLLKVSCSYKDPVTKDVVTLDEVAVKINRTETTEGLVFSFEVDKQRNRLRAAEAMSEARSAAERGDWNSAISILEDCRNRLSESESVRAGDAFCVGLGNELREMQDRMANRQVYETSGRAYVLSGMSSHLYQRATTRSDTTSSTNLSQTYQTTIMADMITRSQTLVYTPSCSPVRPRSLSELPSPR